MKLLPLRIRLLRTIQIAPGVYVTRERRRSK